MNRPESSRIPEKHLDLLGLFHLQFSDSTENSTLRFERIRDIPISEEWPMNRLRCVQRGEAIKEMVP